jgi:hypothetical protein
MCALFSTHGSVRHGGDASANYVENRCHDRAFLNGGSYFDSPVERTKIQTGSRMLRIWKKSITFILAVALTVGVPISVSHAHMAAPTAAIHEFHAVQNYADLAVDPATGDCPQAVLDATHKHDDGSCNKCCGVCVGVSIMPTVPVAILKLSVMRDTLPMRDHILTAHCVPTEPDIPKPL